MMELLPLAGASAVVFLAHELALEDRIERIVYGNGLLVAAAAHAAPSTGGDLITGVAAIVVNRCLLARRNKSRQRDADGDFIIDLCAELYAIPTQQAGDTLMTGVAYPWAAIITYSPARICLDYLSLAAYARVVIVLMVSSFVNRDPTLEPGPTVVSVSDVVLDPAFAFDSISMKAP
ncbi:hypothetical protein EVAR_100188_1 [Eumeta japonica]|uniref:Uncharacterized protein n=1 Tax=Eumeta variegata TaxID=151549 RepID=A0A4C2ACE5_EUMVA|nr:hypothetical protein EVAR_100188_1 [Eumeta japonica]